MENLKCLSQHKWWLINGFAPPVNWCKSFLQIDDCIFVQRQINLFVYPFRRLNIHCIRNENVLLLLFVLVIFLESVYALISMLSYNYVAILFYWILLFKDTNCFWIVTVTISKHKFIFPFLLFLLFLGDHLFCKQDVWEVWRWICTSAIFHFDAS